MAEKETLSERIRDPAHRIDLIATILMSIAIVSSAYCAYEATRWSGVQAISFAQASTARIESSKASNTGWQQVSYDASSLLTLAEAYVLGETDVVDELGERFIRDDFLPFVEEWIALDPLNNPEAAATPFELADYKNEELLRSEALDVEAEGYVQEAREANQNGDNYIMTTVFFALVLFFAGISIKLDFRLLQWVVLVLASVGLIAGFIRILSLPYY